MTRNEKIISLHDKLSYGLIAKECKTTRNVVAGIIFRYRHPYKTRVSKPGGKKNKIGTGYRNGKHAKLTLYNAT